MTQLFFVAAMLMLSGSPIALVRRAHAFSNSATVHHQTAVVRRSLVSVAPDGLRTAAVSCSGNTQRQESPTKTTTTTRLAATDSRRLRFYGKKKSIDVNIDDNSAFFERLRHVDHMLHSARSISTEAARVCVQQLAAVSKEDWAFGTRARSHYQLQEKRMIHHEETMGASSSSSSSPSSSAALKEPEMVFQSTKPRPESSFAPVSKFAVDVPFSSESIYGSNNYEPKRSYGPYIHLTQEERDLFTLLRRARQETNLKTTLRVAGGWVRDKLLATSEFKQTSNDSSSLERLTSKFKSSSSPSSMGRQGTKVIQNDDNDPQPVDIDIALDDLLGREFADCLNEYLSGVGEDTVSVGVVLKNPEKSKHLETATMKVGAFWIDFVNLRAEEYTQNSRIPDLMRIGTPAEDAFRRDLTINSLFYNINNGEIEDWTGRGFDDLRRGVVATPLAPLTTLLDDPLRVLRSIRFAARLRFTMDDELVNAAKDARVHRALAEKVSRERVGGEVDLMLRSPDPVGAMRLLINLKLIGTVFPLDKYFNDDSSANIIYDKGLKLLSTAFDHLSECRAHPPVWCETKMAYTTHGVDELTLREDENARRLLWYSAFLKPLLNEANKQPQAVVSKRQGKNANRSVVCRLLIEELKRPVRDAEAVEKIMRAADDFTELLDGGCDFSAMSILLSEIQVHESLTETLDDGSSPRLECSMNGRRVDSLTEDDPVWRHAMEFRLWCSKIIKRIGPPWRAALVLALSEQLVRVSEGQLEYAIEGDYIDESQDEERLGEIERFDAFAAAMQRIGIIGIWGEKPLLDGKQLKKILPKIPRGPSFRDVMDEQESWMVSHPGAPKEALVAHLIERFPKFR